MTQHIRFYEHNPTVKQAISLLLKFPFKIRSTLAQGSCAIAENDFSADAKVSDLKSLGPQQVLALYKAQFQRRAYDRDPYMTKLLNYLVVLSPGDQFFLSVKILDLIDITRELMRACKQNHLNLQAKELDQGLERLISTYVRCGLQEAQELLQEMTRALTHLGQALRQGNPLSAPPLKALLPQPHASPLPHWENILSEHTGMRLRLE